MLLSLFPDDPSNQGIHPASMFISFISTKEFFSIINRRLVENYKLNFFDITIDPFEFKIGFGENVHIKQKDIDLYYSYCASANMNGFRFTNIANIGNSITLLCATECKDYFKDLPQEYFLNFLYTCYLLFFVFAGKIKVFPFANKQDNYNRFVQVFFSFYIFIFEQSGNKIPQDTIELIKKRLLNNVDLFFMLYHSYLKINCCFGDQTPIKKDFYIWLFGDEFKTDQQDIIDDFARNNVFYTSRIQFGAIENKLFQVLLPSDILMRYLFIEGDMQLIIDNLISKIYHQPTIKTYLHSFLKDESLRESFITYLTDYKHFKKNFFQGIQKHIITSLKKDFNEDLNEDNFEEMLSRVGEDDEDNKENFKIPEKIKQESKIMEKVLNFFITFVGGFRVARGENFFLRLHRPELIKEIISSEEIRESNEKNLSFYGNMLYSYGKNIFYYKYINENVRLGKQRFYLPFKSSNKKTYSNLQILKFFDETHISILLQDINTKDIKIYSKNKKLLTLFKDTFGKEISLLVQKTDKAIIKAIYTPIDKTLQQKKLVPIIEKHLLPQDLYHIKENLYNLDMWMQKTIQEHLIKHKKILFKDYEDSCILGIHANLRETLFGFLLYIYYLKKEEQKIKKQNYREIIIDMYINNILFIQTTPEEEKVRKEIFTLVESSFAPFFDIISYLDENEDFLKMGSESRAFLCEKKPTNIIKKSITGEDVVRCKGYFKSITYYNKRFLLPK